MQNFHVRHSGMVRWHTRPGISRFYDVQLHIVVRCGACHRAALRADPLASPRNDKPHAMRCAPASIRTISPVMLLEAGVARKQTRPATSSAVEARLSGTFDTTESRTLAAPSTPRPLVN